MRTCLSVSSWILGVVCGLGLCVLAGVGTSREREVIKGREFILEDDQGRRRCRMSIVDSVAQMAMFDDKGRERLRLSEGETPRLELFDVAGKQQVAIGLRTDGGSAFIMRDEKNMEGFRMFTAGGNTDFSAWDTTGRVRFGVNISDGNEVWVGLLDRESKAIWRQSSKAAESKPSETKK